MFLISYYSDPISFGHFYISGHLIFLIRTFFNANTILTIKWTLINKVRLLGDLNYYLIVVLLQQNSTTHSCQTLDIYEC